MKFLSKFGVIFNLILSTASIQLFAADTPKNQLIAMDTQRTVEYAQRHQQFRNLFFKENEKEFIRLVKEGQSPKTLFIGCSDSRVIPELIATSNPGELFVIRTAGNFVPYDDPAIMWDGVAATIQYAVEVLGVSEVIVCGHSDCGAIKGLFQDIKLETLEHWLRFGHEAKKMTLLTLGHNASDAMKYSIAERISVLYQLDHLMTYPYIKSKVKEQKLHLHGWHFTIDTGEIEYYDPATLKFVSLSTLLEKPVLK